LEGFGRGSGEAGEGGAAGIRRAGLTAGVTLTEEGNGVNEKDGEEEDEGEDEK
jgi:hypothetical protein